MLNLASSDLNTATALEIDFVHVITFNRFQNVFPNERLIISEVKNLFQIDQTSSITFGMALKL